MKSAARKVQTKEAFMAVAISAICWRSCPHRSLYPGSISVLGPSVHHVTMVYRRPSFDWA